MRLFLRIISIALPVILVFMFKNPNFNYPLSDHYDQKVFYNPDKHIVPPGVSSLLKWKINGNGHLWPDYIAGEKDLPPQEVSGSSVRISAVGHATFLIQLQNQNILTDPIWSDRASPLQWVGPKRIVEPGIDFNKLPRIDIVLISHNHYDHLDVPTIKRLWQHSRPVFIVPLGNQEIVKKALPDAVVYDLDWYQQQKVGPFVIHAIPSQHWSSRTIVDKNKYLWAGFIVESSFGQICFIGDSGYSKKMFQEIGNKFNNITFAIIPIGAYEPRWFMQEMHMNPEEALMAYQDMRAKFFIPSHFGVFKLTDESYQAQLDDYEAAINKLGIDVSNIFTLKAGQFTFKDL